MINIQIKSKYLVHTHISSMELTVGCYNQWRNHILCSENKLRVIRKPWIELFFENASEGNKCKLKGRSLQIFQQKFCIFYKISYNSLQGNSCTTYLIIDLAEFQPFRVNVIPVAHLELVRTNLDTQIHIYHNRSQHHSANAHSQI